MKAFRLALLADDSDTEKKDDPMSTDQKIPDDQEKPKAESKDTPAKDKDQAAAVDDEGKMAGSDTTSGDDPAGGSGEPGAGAGDADAGKSADAPTEEVNPITDPEVDPEDRPRPDLDQLHVVKVGEQSAEENRQLELKKDTK